MNQNADLDKLVVKPVISTKSDIHKETDDKRISTEADFSYNRKKRSIAENPST